jgi:hypothetical protein
MYWTWDHAGESMVSWGQPRSIPREQVGNLQPDYSVKVYAGEEIRPEDSVIFSMQGDATLGMGDSIWLISFIRDVYRVHGRRRCRMDVATSETIGRFYARFLPSSIRLVPEYLSKQAFDAYTHKLPAMYYWKERDEADRSWTDNRSILERLYRLVGIQYEGLPDFGEFTDEKILYPNDEFYRRLGIGREEKYVFLQWHSSGEPKNLPPKTNIKLLRHITQKYGLKVYVIGRLSGLDRLEEIPGVVNLSKKTLAEDVFSLAFGAEFIVSPDSAGIHLGEAYRVPAVGIMSTLPPVYVAQQYKIPAFLFGAGFCPHKPCGVVTHLPKDKCPNGNGHYCAVLDDIDLDLFDRCVEQTFANRRNYRRTASVDFYQSQNLPIVLN